MSVSVEVLEGGFATSLQDLGRTTGKAYGVPPGGALDRFAHRAANTLVGNLPQAATLEIILQGPVLHFEQNSLISITGADFKPHLDGRPMPMWASLFVRGGQILSFENINASAPGRAAYLAIHGGWDAPLIMGSRSTYPRARLGGYRGEGRNVSMGDCLANGQDWQKPVRHLAEHAGRFFPANQLPPYGKQVSVRLIPGPHNENFTPATYENLFNTTYRLSEQSDRMGFRFDGLPLAHKQPELAEIAAGGTVFGAIQVPSNGQPIILMADHQVTGGYPLIGVVIEQDLPLIAQLLPGQHALFSLHTLD